jgi:large subunit ribosomal protein L19
MTSILLKNSNVVKSHMREGLPKFTVGSVIKVYYKIIEGTKERIQIFQGIVIDIHGKTSLDSTFKVLKVATGGIKTVRVFPFHSPNIDKIEIISLQRGRRANLNYLLGTKDPIKAIRSKKVTLN